MKPFTVLELAFKITQGHSRSLAMLSFVKLTELFIRDRKSSLQLFSGQ